MNEFTRFFKFLRREVKPILEPMAKIVIINKLVAYDVENEAADFARKNGVPEYLAVEFAKQIRGKLVEVVSNL